MTTLTIQGDNATIDNILELIQGVKDKVIVSKGYKIDICNDTPQSFKNEAEFKAHIKKVSDEIDLLRAGNRSDLISFDEFKAEANQW